MSSRTVVLLGTLLVCVAGCRAEYSSGALATHLDTLLAEYDREEAPHARAVVALALDVRHAALEDSGATMHLLADLQMSWMDPRLVWNASQWEGDSILVTAERLWTPDVQLVSAGRARDDGTELRARLSARGAVSHVRRLDLDAPVALQLADWPKDTQQADFKFASPAHSIDELDLVVNEYKGRMLVESGAWEIVDVNGAAIPWRRGDEVEGAGARAGAWTVRVARRGAALAVQHGAVLAAASLLLAAAAARPYSQRMPLAACATLVTALWLMTVIFVVPPSSSTPRIVSLMCALCTLGAASGAGAALAQCVARRSGPPPAALRSLLSKVSAIHTITPDPATLSETRSGAWAAAAQLLDALLTALVLLTLLVLIGVYLLA